MTQLDLRISTEQSELRELVAKFLADKAPLAAQREVFGSESGFDPAVWDQLVEQLGLVGLTIPEEYGGLGFGAVELFAVLHEMGRALYGGPYLASVLAATAVLATGDESACRHYLPLIAAGEVIATLAWAEADGDWATAEPSTTARAIGESWVVDGTKHLVMAVPAADLFLVTARTATGTGLFAVPAARAVVETTVLESLDLTRHVGTVRFTAAPARLLGSVADTRRVVSDVLETAYAAIAAEQAGGATQCLQMSVQYAKDRTQFGVPIGSYQAVAHACAEMLLQAEHATSAAHYAAAAHGSDEFSVAARAAAAYAGEAYKAVTTATIQVHGGIGFTWEHDAHLYYRRARSSALLFSTADRLYAEIASLSGLG